jgi:hypothetical protein
MRKLLFILSLFIAVFFAAPTESSAQCPMCKISMESNLNNGGTAGKGLNKGILYLFSMPYLIIGGLGYYWYKNQKLVEGEESSEN